MVEIQHLSERKDLHEPRRVMKYVLVWCTSGSIVMTIDEKDYSLTPNSVVTITSGQIHFLKNSQAAQGLILEFTFDFFCRNDNDIELIFHNSLFCHFAMNEVIDLRDDKTVGLQLYEMKKELEDQPYQYLISIHSRLEIMLVSINRCKVKSGTEIYKPDALFLRFLEMVRHNFRKNMTVKQIATKLSTTESRLNELSRLHTGKTAQNVIYGLVASEAKRLFVHEKLSVKEVAYELGFKDPFYFSNFFKRHTNQSPKAYKDSFGWK